MVTVLLDATALDIVLSRTEKLLTRHSSDLRIDRAHIRRAQLTDDPWTWLRGVPSPGTLVPRTLAMGTWRAASGADFVLLRRNHAAIVIDLDGDAEFERIILTTRHGLALVHALHLDADDTDLVVSDEKPKASRRRRAPRPATA